MKSRVGSLGRALWAGAIVLASASAGRAAPDAAALFTTKCTSCHSFGKGERIGPDLKGVTDRHARYWLIAWIRSSDKLIRSGDATATALFQKHRGQRMPDHDLTDTQITALLDYLAVGGPELDEQRQIRKASSATAEEVTLGRSLFYGKVPLSSGGLSCASCHALSKQRALGGSFAPDLTQAYTRLWDRNLGRWLERSCLPRVPTLKEGARRVTDAESLALRAFLRTVNLDELRAATTAGSSNR